MVYIIFVAVVDPPDAPVLSVESVNFFSVQLKWEQMNVFMEEVDFYYVTYTAINGTDDVGTPVTVDPPDDVSEERSVTRTKTISLSSNTQYSFFVVAANSVGCSKRSNTVFATTDPQTGEH